MLLFPLICDTCGKVAMYTTYRLPDIVMGPEDPDNVLCAANTILLSGERPVDDIDDVICGNCGYATIGFHYESDQPVEIEFTPIK